MLVNFQDIQVERHNAVLMNPKLTGSYLLSPLATSQFRRELIDIEGNKKQLNHNNPARHDKMNSNPRN